MNPNHTTNTPFSNSTQDGPEYAATNSALVAWTHEKPPGKREIALELVFESPLGHRFPRYFLVVASTLHCSLRARNTSFLCSWEVVGVAERKVAALVPPQLAHGAGRRLLSSRNAQLDVVDLLAGPRAGSLVYGMGKIDTWGLVSNRSTIDTLGWVAGDRLHIVLVGGSVVVHRDEAGAFAMGTRPYLMIPAAVRHHSGLRPRDLVLMAADPNHDVLVVHPLAAVDTMITAYHASLTTTGSNTNTGGGGAGDAR